MKASVKLRDEEGKSPLLRAKVPVSILSLPFVASFSAGDPHDLSLHLLTSFHTTTSTSSSHHHHFPSLKFSYHPNPNPNPNLHAPTSNFSLSIRSSTAFPLRFSLHLSPSNPRPTFSLRFSPRLGDFSLTKTSLSDPNPNPNPKENGGGVHHPIPVLAVPDGRRAVLPALEELLSPPLSLRVGTAVPVGPRAGLRVRWAVRLPPEPTGLEWRQRLPYLTLDKVSIVRVDEKEDDSAADKKKKKGDGREWGEKDVAAIGGMCFWMSREVEELRKESASIRESLESVRSKLLENRKGVPLNAASSGHTRAGAAASTARK